MAHKYLSSTFTIQFIEEGVFLVQCDNLLDDYMGTLGQWSNEYCGWLVASNAEGLDLLKLHRKLQVRRAVVHDYGTLDMLSIEEQQQKEREKNVELVVVEADSDDDEDDPDYVPSSEDEDDTDSEYDDEEETDEEDVDEVEEQEEGETIDEEQEDDPDYVLEDEDDEEETDEEELEEHTGDQIGEYQYYKNAILILGKNITKGLDAVYNRYLGGWILHRSDEEKVKRAGYVMNTIVPEDDNDIPIATPIRTI